MLQAACTGGPECALHVVPAQPSPAGWIQHVGPVCGPDTAPSLDHLLRRPAVLVASSHFKHRTLQGT